MATFGRWETIVFIIIEHTRFDLMKGLYEEFNRTASAKDKKSLIRDMEYHRKKRDRKSNDFPFS